ncbi:MAG: hypothetical protein IT298_01495 [Chloroflexi bacterium]|jgi:hypothetical protein|nr:hypothetical protein [Chloroflexota bacterium]MBV6437871.1 hypothetical protein [Anaerolineae bacterium]MDL1915522.1 hypothetical protein [Anaerolineae bacterium CFX4]OQY82894.1 MAG: hypothetical protein B6D42_08625 [Anaerolineae bacterium UTCFX5]MBW7880572.1 hypothetical protein [Anaerolineae bacterium]
MRKFLRFMGRSFWRFMVIFSFIVNLVLVVVVLILAATLFDIKHNIAEPLVGGLYSAFVGLEDATIDWTIPVRADVPVNLDIPINQNTVVTLTEAVPLTVVAQIQAPSLTLSNARVSLSLPVGLQLPVALNLPVTVDDTLPVSLDVRAVIPLKETQLYDVARSLQLMFEPLAVALYNLPQNWGEAFALAGDVLSGGQPNLLAQNAFSLRPWPGFSRTAGLNYPLDLLTAPVPPDNVPLDTGIIPAGGIPLLDEALRPQVYTQGGPGMVNATAEFASPAQAPFWDGSYADYRAGILTQAPQWTPTPEITPLPGGENPGDLGIIPTPTSP